MVIRLGHSACNDMQILRVGITRLVARDSMLCAFIFLFVVCLVLFQYTGFRGLNYCFLEYRIFKHWVGDTIQTCIRLRMFVLDGVLILFVNQNDECQFIVTSLDGFRWLNIFGVPLDLRRMHAAHGNGVKPKLLTEHARRCSEYVAFVEMNCMSGVRTVAHFFVRLFLFKNHLLRTSGHFKVRRLVIQAAMLSKPSAQQPEIRLSKYFVGTH